MSPPWRLLHDAFYGYLLAIKSRKWQLNGYYMAIYGFQIQFNGY